MKNIVFIFISFFLLAPKSFAQEEWGTARIIDHKGTVIHINDESIESFIEGEKIILEGSSIITRDDSYVLLELMDYTKIKIEENSEIFIDDLIFRDHRGYLGTSYINLIFGGITAEVEKKFDGLPSLEINTFNEQAIVVKGTSFYTYLDEKNNDFWTHVKSGSVIARDYEKDDQEEINVGESLVFLKSDKITKPHKYEWTKYLKWNGNISNLDLKSSREKITEFIETEVSKKKKLILKRQPKRFLKDEEGEKIEGNYRKEVKISDSNKSDSSVFNSNIELPIPKIKKKEKIITGEEINKEKILKIASAKKEPEKKLSKKEIKLLNQISKTKSNNLCLKSKKKGFTCSLKNRCKGNNEIELASFPKYSDKNFYKVCLSCNKKDFNTKCEVRKNRCSSSSIFLEVGKIKYYQKNIALCLDIYNS